MTSDPIEDDGVLSPDELRLEDDRVRELEENRYVVRSDESATVSAAETAGDVPATDEQTVSPSDHADALADVPEPHGIDVTLKTDGEIARHRVTSNDVREVFADLLTWYASQLDDDLSPTEALQVMLATTDLEE